MRLEAPAGSGVAQAALQGRAASAPRRQGRRARLRERAARHVRGHVEPAGRVHKHHRVRAAEVLARRRRRQPAVRAARHEHAAVKRGGRGQGRQHGARRLQRAHAWHLRGAGARRRGGAGRCRSQTRAPAQGANAFERCARAEDACSLQQQGTCRAWPPARSAPPPTRPRPVTSPWRAACTQPGPAAARARGGARVAPGAHQRARVDEVRGQQREQGAVEAVGLMLGALDARPHLLPARRAPVSARRELRERPPAPSRTPRTRRMGAAGRTLSSSSASRNAGSCSAARASAPCCASSSMSCAPRSG